MDAVGGSPRARGVVEGNGGGHLGRGEYDLTVERKDPAVGEGLLDALGSSGTPPRFEGERREGVGVNQFGQRGVIPLDDVLLSV